MEEGSKLPLSISCILGILHGVYSFVFSVAVLLMMFFLTLLNNTLSVAVI